MTKIIGATLLASMAVLCWLVGGWKTFVFVFGITGLVCGVVALGIYLLTGDIQ